ncbi:cytochrome b N-terminal domain-containing protein [Acetobacteraceae bacterium ESL0709]|nr:cytochrome b N-terminal domain-containing protein [Acetobacteraceae bacterium ESL0697]MDF7678795.1 cytochrome b N-terminal domain-containing protein [Acetobacteraceae bacterium ESL0709]
MQRLSAFRKIHEHFVNFPMPAVNWLWCLGACLITALGLMGLSGLFLAINYQPDIQHAFSSVMTLERRVPAGWLIRSLHMGGATMLFAALYLHIGRGLWYGSYKAPREFVWLSGLLLMALFMVTAFAGYILPWGQMSFWGATVATHAIGSIPLIGKSLLSLLLGGPELGDVALRRFFVLHFALGFIAVALVALHILCLHGVGSTNPTAESRKPDLTTRPFHPFYTIKDAIAVCVFLMVYTGLIFFLPQLIEKQANLLPANPFKTPPAISPEWYLAPFFAMLRAVPSQLGGLIIALSSIIVLFALPWLDRSPRHNARFRPLVSSGWILFFASFLTLTIAGLEPPSAFWILLSRVALVAWFSIFLILLPYASWRDCQQEVKK